MNENERRKKTAANDSTDIAKRQLSQQCAPMQLNKNVKQNHWDQIKTLYFRRDHLVVLFFSRVSTPMKLNTNFCVVFYVDLFAVHLSCWGCIKRKAQSHISDSLIKMVKTTSRRKKKLDAIALCMHKQSTTNNPNKNGSAKTMYRFVLFYGSFSQVNLLVENKERARKHMKREKQAISHFVCMTHVIKTSKICSELN